MKSLLNCRRCEAQVDDATLRFTSCCSYVLCQTCAADYTSSSNISIDSQLSCNSCIRELTDNQMSLNEEVGSLIKRANKLQKVKRESITCSRCSVGGLGVFKFCETCNQGNSDLQKSRNQLLCESCFESIHSIGSYVFHSPRIIPADFEFIDCLDSKEAVELVNVEQQGILEYDQNSSRQLRCSLHPEEIAKKMCSKHTERFCEECAVMHRRQCSGNSLLIELVERDQRGKFMRLVDECTQTIRGIERESEKLGVILKQTKSNVKAAKASLEGVFTDIVSQIEMTKSKFVAAIDSEMNSRIEFIQREHASQKLKMDNYMEFKRLAEVAVLSSQASLIQLLPSMSFFSNAKSAIKKDEIAHCKSFNYNANLFASMDQLINPLALLSLYSTLEEIQLSQFTIFAEQKVMQKSMTMNSLMSASERQKSQSDKLNQYSINGSIASASIGQAKKSTKTSISSVAEDQVKRNNHTELTINNNNNNQTPTIKLSPQSYSSRSNENSSPQLEQSSTLLIASEVIESLVDISATESELIQPKHSASLNSLLTNILQNSSAISVNSNPLLSLQQSPQKKQQQQQQQQLLHQEQQRLVSTDQPLGIPPLSQSQTTLKQQKQQLSSSKPQMSLQSSTSNLLLQSSGGGGGGGSVSVKSLAPSQVIEHQKICPSSASSKKSKVGSSAFQDSSPFDPVILPAAPTPAPVNNKHSKQKASQNYSVGGGGGSSGTSTIVSSTNGNTTQNSLQNTSTSTELSSRLKQADHRSNKNSTTNRDPSNNNVPPRESSRQSRNPQSNQAASKSEQFTPVKRSSSVAKKNVYENSIPSKLSSAQRASSNYNNTTNSTTSVYSTGQVAFSSSRVSRGSVHEFPELANVEIASATNEFDRDPLLKRIITKTAASSTSIRLEWMHPSLLISNLNYAVDYGIGMKIGGNEQFKRVYYGPLDSFVIEGLQPKTNYRVRVAPSMPEVPVTPEGSLDNLQFEVSVGNTKTTDDLGSSSSSSSSNATLMATTINQVAIVGVATQTQVKWGEWSEVATICTQDYQSIDEIECAQVSRKEKEITVQFFYPGIVTGSFAYVYGKATWDVTASVSSHGGGEDISACLIVGVMNKQKKNQIVGSTVNYGLHRETLKIKVQLDMSRGTMVIFTPSSPVNGEVFNNLPQGSLFPAFQNKSSQKAVLCSLKLKVVFE